MEAPPGAVQRAVLVGVPLGLIALIFVTPPLLGRGQPQPTDIPFLLAQVIGHPWDGSANETALLYVRSALGVPLYDLVAINVTSRTPGLAFTEDCGGIASGGGANWTCEETRVPSLFAKVPAVDRATYNVTAVAILQDARFVYNATIEFRWGETDWTLRVWPEDATSPETYVDVFSTSMRLEARP